MTHTCNNCGETFKTLTRKRLHDCNTQLGVGDHNISDDLPQASEVLIKLPITLPKRFLVMPEAAQLDDDPSLGRFFPILSAGEEEQIHDWKIGVGYVETDNNHVLIGYNGHDKQWVVIENRTEPKFNNSENELACWLAEHNYIDPYDIIGYDSGDDDYPEFGY